MLIQENDQNKLCLVNLLTEYDKEIFKWGVGVLILCGVNHHKLGSRQPRNTVIANDCIDAMGIATPQCRL